MRHLEVDRLKEDLLDLYDKWDVLNALILDKLVLVEESLNKFKSVEEDLGKVSDFLKTEVNHLYLKMTRNNRDSGISDGSELRLDKGILVGFSRVHGNHVMNLFTLGWHDNS